MLLDRICISNVKRQVSRNVFSIGHLVGSSFYFSTKVSVSLSGISQCTEETQADTSQYVLLEGNT